MSFKCEKCGNYQGAGKKPIRVVVETRVISYPQRYADPEHKICIDNGGAGTAIVKESNMCNECAQAQ